MRSVIQQSVVLPAPPDRLYDMYLSPAEHEAITGAPVVIDAAGGAEFRAFGGMLSGTMLAVARPRLVVQSWRSAHFHESDPDSTLILAFSPAEGGGRIDLVHLDVPAHDYDAVVEGWDNYYWRPWQNRLASLQ